MKNVIIFFVLMGVANVIYAQKLLHPPQLLHQTSDAKIERLRFDNNGDRYQVIILTYIDNTIDTIAVLGSDNDTSVLKNVGVMPNFAVACKCSHKSNHYKNTHTNVFYTDTTFSFAGIKKDFIFETGAIVRFKKSNNKWTLKDIFEITSPLSNVSPCNISLMSNNIICVDCNGIEKTCNSYIVVINEDKTLTFFSEDTTIQTGIPRLPPKH